MPGEISSELFVTFFLAIIGYAGLTIKLILSLFNIRTGIFWHFVSIIILIHVVMIWIYRYEWQFCLSVRNGYEGFLIFHSALLLIIVSNFIKENPAKILIIISFAAVTAGAVGAVFKYDVVALYKIPVLMCAFTGSAGLLVMIIRKFLSITRNRF